MNDYYSRPALFSLEAITEMISGRVLFDLENHYRVSSYMARRPVMTHELGVVGSACEAVLKEAFPEIDRMMPAIESICRRYRKTGTLTTVEFQAKLQIKMGRLEDRLGWKMNYVPQLVSPVELRFPETSSIIVAIP